MTTKGRRGVIYLFMDVPEIAPKLKKGVKSPVDLYFQSTTDHGRNADYPAPPVQIPACTANALGSCLG